MRELGAAEAANEDGDDEDEEENDEDDETDDGAHTQLEVRPELMGMVSCAESGCRGSFGWRGRGQAERGRGRGEVEGVGDCRKWKVAVR